MKDRVEQVCRSARRIARPRPPDVRDGAIVGYTNAGKSSLLNALVGSEVAKAEDMLDARPDVTPGEARRRPADRHRHGRVHPQAAPSARRSFRATLEEATGPTSCSRSSTRPIRTSASTGRRSRRPRRAARAAPRRSTRPTRRGCRLERRRACAGARDRPRQRTDRLRARHARAEIAAPFSSLWVELDVNIPYAAASSARVRERGTVELEYGERDVWVSGRKPSSRAS